ncbi:MAG: hypothetical protein Q8908_04350 [Bacteroidota bacterium]|nr:hypothetical protein [Bacteroidota bacterium]
MKNKLKNNNTRMVMMRKYRFKRIVLFAAVLLLMAGCIPERKIGAEYLSKRQNITLVIRAPEWIKMENLSYDSLKDVEGLSQREQDSIKYYNSQLLQNIKDSTFIGNYVKNLKITLENQGYKTMLASVNDTIFPVTGNAFLINIGQIELDESKIPIRDETQYNGKLYGADYDIAKLEMCFWIEVCKIENGIALQPPRLLFDSQEQTDDDDGYFKLDDQSNKMNYVLNQKEIQPEDVYSYASSIGSDHGFRLNDFLLNEYIAYSLPQKKNRVLLGVNPNFGLLLRIGAPPFQEIHQ